MTAALIWLIIGLARAEDPAVVERQIVHLGQTVRVVTVDLDRAQVELVGQSPSVRTIAAARARVERDGRSALAITNGGIFHADHTPVGLHIERGEQTHPLERGAGEGNFYLLPNGVFSIGPAGAAVSNTERIEPSAARLATQSGPQLLDGGVVHPAFRADSRSRRVRSGVCAQTPRRMHLAISLEPVRFHDFATMFRDALGCAEALYLDGVISALWTPDGVTGLENHRFASLLVVSAQ